jgi:hypothetical protein
VHYSSTVQKNPSELTASTLVTKECDCYWLCIGDPGDCQHTIFATPQERVRVTRRLLPSSPPEDCIIGSHSGSYLRYLAIHFLYIGLLKTSRLLETSNISRISELSSENFKTSQNHRTWTPDYSKTKADLIPSTF